MRHGYSLAHLTVLSLSPPQVLQVAARAGYDYTSLRITRVTPFEPLYDLARDRALMRETKTWISALGIKVHDVELFRMDPALEPESFVPELEATAELGARMIIAQLPDADRARATDRFARLCDLARPLGIGVNLEFPHWTETGTLAEAARVVSAVQKENAGILVDVLHMARSSSSLEELAQTPREWLRFAHVCDAPREIPPTLAGIIRTARDERLFPGEGECGVREILSCMPDDIPYSLEIPRVTLSKAIGPENLARLALLVTKSHLEGEDYPVHDPRAWAARSKADVAARSLADFHW
jgi:sugar phosphate isomerase/epimerase